jgi:MFS family permease
MSVLGVSGVSLGVLLMGIADRFGRKPVAVAGSLISLCFPLTAIYYSGPMVVFLASMFLGWALTSMFPLFLSTIPSESVSTRSISTVIGFMVAVSNLVGGAAFPMIAGWCADQWGLRAALWIEAGCAAGAGILSMALRETAPSKVSGYASSRCY